MANAAERLFALHTLRASPGWALYCAQQAKALEDLDKKLRDVDTSDDETRHLKHARVYLIEQYAPAKILSKLLNATDADAKREQEEIDQLNRKSA